MSSVWKAMRASPWSLGRYQVLSKVFRKELGAKATLVTVVRKKMAKGYTARNHTFGS